LTVLLLCNTSTKRLQDFNPIHTTFKVCQHAAASVVAAEAAADVVASAADSVSVAVVTLVAAVAVAVAVVMIAVAVDPVAVVAAVEAIRICLSAADLPDLLPLQEATVGHQPFHLEFTCKFSLHSSHYATSANSTSANVQPTPPDAKVKALEDKLVLSTKGQMTIDGFPGRKSYGTKGKPVTLRTNYFHVQLAHEVDKKVAEKPLHRYAIDYADNEMPKPKKRRAVEQILKMPAFQKLTHATDFAATIVTIEKLDDAVLKKTDLEVVLPVKGSDKPLDAPANDAPEHVKKARARNTVKFKITLVGSFNLRDLSSFINSTSSQALYGDYQNLVQMLNIIMCKAPNEANAVAKLPGNKFYPHAGLLGEGGHPRVEAVDLAGGLVALRGYYSSVRCATGRILLNLNVTSGAFYHSVPLLDLATRFGARDPEQWEMFIRKLKVLYKRPGKDPIQGEKTIIGLAKPMGGKTKVVVKRFGNANDVTFKLKDHTKGPMVQEREITVFNYFKELGYTLKQPNAPVLNVGTPSDPIYIPAELCTVLPGQPYRKFLSGDQTTKMLKFAARVPNKNAMSIAGDANTPGTGLRLLDLQGAPDEQSRSIERFGLKANTSMLTVEGRILTAPDVLYGKKKKVTPFNGSWNCAGQAFAKGGSFAGWIACVLNVAGRPSMYPDPNQNKQLIQKLGVELKNYGVAMGTYQGVQERVLQNLTMANRAQNNTVLDNFFQEAVDHKCPLVFVVLPNYDKWLHARIKYYGDVRHGIHTICSIGSKLSKENGQGMYMGNLALKFNLKGGGVNQEVADTLIKPLDNSTMVMGIDVTHPSPGSAKGAPSIASAVASRDARLAQWPGSIRKQTGKQEMIDQKRAEFGDCVSDAILQEMVVERLECWRKYNNRQLPNKILLYRDGVSEGQYALVLRQELPHFEAAFAKLYGPEKNWPKMSVIVVGKRHHTRFYATKEQDADYNPQRQKGSLNTKPGTVVDRGITGNSYHEMFLQAHQGLQGTARPAHYVVIKDQIGLDANCLEQVTLNLCHLFGRAPKAVSCAPPAYYADILATRGREYLFNTLQEDHSADSTTGSNDDTEWDGTVHKNLKDSMFYL
jgi:eukaryotic translation initiation factor 2C